MVAEAFQISGIHGMELLDCVCVKVRGHIIWAQSAANKNFVDNFM